MNPKILLQTRSITVHSNPRLMKDRLYGFTAALFILLLSAAGCGGNSLDTGGTEGSAHFSDSVVSQSGDPVVTQAGTSPCAKGSSVTPEGEPGNPENGSAPTSTGSDSVKVDSATPSPNGSGSVMEANDDNFEAEVSKNNLPVLVFFWAQWSGPSRVLIPTLEALAKDYSGKIVVYKMNVDENTIIPTQFAIHSIPTLVLLKDGQKVDQIIGTISRSDLEERVKKGL